jgi:cell division protein FtsL
MGKGDDMKKLQVIIPVLVGMLILSGAVVKYATSDLTDRVTRAEEKILTAQRDIQSKANTTEINLAIKGIEDKVKEIKDSNDELKKEVKSLLSELIKIKWRK